MLKRSPTAVIGVVIVSIVILCGIFAPWISPYDPIKTDLYSRLKPPGKDHWLGTDKLGRDVLSRIIWGARVSLKVGVISVGIGMIIGVFLGLIGGYFGGIMEKFIFSLVDGASCLVDLSLDACDFTTLFHHLGGDLGIDRIGYFLLILIGFFFTLCFFSSQDFYLLRRFFQWRRCQSDFTSWRDAVM